MPLNNFHNSQYRQIAPVLILIDPPNFAIRKNNKKKEVTNSMVSQRPLMNLIPTVLEFLSTSFAIALAALNTTGLFY